MCIHIYIYIYMYMKRPKRPVFPQVKVAPASPPQVWPCFWDFAEKWAGSSWMLVKKHEKSWILMAENIWKIYGTHI